jgi:hypothetical protein
MGNYILSILKTQLLITCSWGFNSPKSLPNNEGLQFKVNGFKHQGFVKVIYNEGKDLFEIILLTNKGEEKQRITDVFLDLLVETIDLAVERTDNYTEKVKQTYNK